MTVVIMLTTTEYMFRKSIWRSKTRDHGIFGAREYFRSTLLDWWQYNWWLNRTTYLRSKKKQKQKTKKTKKQKTKKTKKKNKQQRQQQRQNVKLPENIYQKFVLYALDVCKNTRPRSFGLGQSKAHNRITLVV